MNQLTISGKTWEINTKYSPSGVCISESSISVYDGKDKNTQKAKYFNVNYKVFGQLAENVGNEIKKQDNILVTGKMTVETWEKDGIKHYKNVLIVDEIGKTISRFSGQQQANNQTDMSGFGMDISDEIIPF